jgi:hypothetical protein
VAQRVGEFPAWSINDARGVRMRGVLTVMLACALSGAGAMETRMEQNNSAAACGELRDAFDIRLALRNSTLYEQVYVWMHEKNVENWNYSRAVKVNGSTETECATVTYDTYIESPTFFAQMMRNFMMSMNFAIGVRKEVCVDGQTVVETATVSVPVIHELSLTSRYEVGADEVYSSLEAEYHVSWYIDFLMYDIEQHLRQNFALKLDSVAQSLCAPRGEKQYALLRSPAEKFTMSEMRREAALRPLKMQRLKSPLRRRVEQLPL